MKLEELFATFHDFDIVALYKKGDDLIITFRIPWGEMWNEYDFQIKTVFKGGQIVQCKYFEWTDGDDSEGQPNSIDKETTDLSVISSLGIDVQKFKSLGKDQYVFYCNGYEKVGGAEITIRTDNFELLDIKEKPLDTKKYESWFNDWWTSINKK